jgi:hypothetical protein
MKSIVLTPVAYAALLLGCTIANAQNSPNTPPDQSSTAPMSDQADTTKGNNLVGTTPANQVSTPPTAGQDKSSGNDLVTPNDNANNGMRQASAAHPDFDTLDTKKKGSLTPDDVKGNKWLSKKFARCDSDHDGTLSRQEYAACK